jgi:hypothetical protein
MNVLLPILKGSMPAIPGTVRSEQRQGDWLHPPHGLRLADELLTKRNVGRGPLGHLAAGHRAGR